MSNSDHPTTPPEEDQQQQNQQKPLDRELRGMISALNHCLNELKHAQKKEDSSDHSQDEDDHGVKIITLAGSNVGATMRGEQYEKSGLHGTPLDDELDPLSTLVNSNFQAINNSIMMRGSHSSNDPGVHMEVSDYVENKSTHKHVKENKKAEKNFSTSDPSD